MQDYEIQLGSLASSKSVNANNYIPLELTQETNEINEYDNLDSVLSAAQLYDDERQNTAIYRIYGKVQWLSLLNGLNNNYSTLSDIFLHPVYPINVKNILNSFDFYLLKPVYSGYTALTGLINMGINLYIRYFEVIATPQNFDTFNAGFDTNLFNEQNCGFNVNLDINIENLVDNFGMPLQQIFIYPVYKIKKNGSGHTETMKSVVYGQSGNTNIINLTYPSTGYTIGNIIYGDCVQYIQTQFLQFTQVPQTYYIGTPVISGYTLSSVPKFGNLSWTYNPFIPLQLFYFSDDLKLVNISGSTYTDVNNIPSYATNIGQGNYVWRDILQQGYIDSISGNGVDYPFVNMRRYLFNYNIIDFDTNLNDNYTANVFNQIELAESTILSINPNSNLALVGNQC